MGVGGHRQTLAALHPGRIPVPVGGVLVGPRAGLDEFLAKTSYVLTTEN